MMTKLTISEKCSFHSQVVNSWLPSRDHEFIRWMECYVHINTSIPYEWNAVAATVCKQCKVNDCL